MRDVSWFLSFTEPNGDCLEWQRCLNSDGYPRCSWGGNSNGKVHRIVCELSGQDITGKVVRHTCHNPKCINPKHLITGYPKDNVSDMDRADRRYRKLRSDMVAAVRELDARGLSRKEISEALGIDQRRVSEICLNKRDADGRLAGG